MSPVMLVVALGVIALLVVAVGAVLWIQGEQRRQRNDLWRAVAEARGGHFTEEEQSLFLYQPPMIDVVVGDVVVRLDYEVVQAGKSRQLHTRASASHALATGPSFEVFREGLFQAMGKALGGQDVVLGTDGLFDAHFVVKCDDPVATREVWTSWAQTVMRKEFENARAVSDGSTVTIVDRRMSLHPGAMSTLLDLVGTLASAGTRHLAPYRGLDGARWVPASGSFDSPTPPRLTIETARGEVDVDAFGKGWPPRVRLRIAHRHDVAPFSIDLDHADAPGLPKGLLTERARALVPPLLGATVAGDESMLQLTWREPPSPDVLEAGVRLLAELAGGSRSEGAFR